MCHASKKKESLHKNGKSLEEPTSLLHMSHQASKYLSDLLLAALAF